MTTSTTKMQIASSGGTDAGSSGRILFGDFDPEPTGNIYLDVVRDRVGNADFALDTKRFRAAILFECAKQIDALGEVDSASFAWLRNHEQTCLDVLFPGSRHETHDPAEFPRSMGRFVLLGVIGRGGFATVYTAIDIEYRRNVALKALNVGTTGGERAKRQLIEEAKKLQETNCAHVVRVYGIYEIGRETVIAMSLLTGGNLSELLKQHGPFSREDAAEMLRQVAAGIAAAHDRNIVHRDLKPGNILQGKNNTWYVADFGLAKRLDESLSHSSPHQEKGTFGYSSPEQLKRQDVTAQTDIFAVGLILFEAVTGKRAFDADGPVKRLEKIVNQVGIGSAENRALLGKQLFAIVAKCLQPFPEHRYGSIEQLRSDLASFLAGQAVSVRPPSLLVELKQLVAHRKKTFAGLTAAILAGLVFLALLVDGAAKRRLGIELQRQGLIRSALAELNDTQAAARDLAVEQLLRANRLRADVDLLDPFVAAQLKPGLIAQWNIPGKPFLGFDVTDDGRTAAVAGTKGEIKIIGRHGGAVLALPAKVPQDALFLQWAPGGNYLAAMHRLPKDAANDQRRPFFVWQLETQQTLPMIPQGIHDEGWTFSHDGNSIVVADAARAVVRQIDLGTGTTIHQFEIPDGQWVRGMALGPGDRTISIAYANTRVVERRLLADATQLDRWVVPREIQDIHVGPSGHVAVATGKDIYIFRPGDSQATSILHAHDQPVDRVRYSRFGDRLLTRSNGRSFKMWDAASSQLLMEHVSTRHVNFVRGDREIAGFSSDVGFSVARLTQDKLRPAMDLASAGALRAVAFSAQGAEIFVASDQGLLRWQMDSPQRQQSMIDGLPSGDVKSLGGRLFSVHRFQVRLQSEDGTQNTVGAFPTSEHHYGSAMACDSKGNRLAVVQRATNEVLLISADSAARKVACGNVRALALSAAGQWLATSSWELNSTTQIWNAQTGEMTTEIPVSASGLAFLADPNLLMIGTPDAYEIWDIAAAVLTKTQQQEPIQSITRTLGNAEAPVAVSADRRYVALALADRAVSVYDAATRQPLISLPSYRASQISKLVFSPRNDRLATLTQDGSLIVWRLDLLRQACAKAELPWPLEIAGEGSLAQQDVPVARRFQPRRRYEWLPDARRVGAEVAPLHRRIEKLRTTIADDPSDHHSRDELARLCLNLGGLEESLNWFEQANAIERRHERLYFIGLLNAALDRDSAAASQQSTLMDLPFDKDGQAQWLARLVLLRGDDADLVARARQSIDRQLAASPGNRWLLQFQALALARSGEAEQAIALLETTYGVAEQRDALQTAIAAVAQWAAGNDEETAKLIEHFDHRPIHRIPDLRLFAQLLIDGLRAHLPAP